MTRTARFTLPSAVVVGVLVLYSACSPSDVAEPRAAGPSFAATSNPTVTSTDPSGGKQGMTLDVQVIGSGFDNGSKADFLLGGQVTQR